MFVARQLKTLIKHTLILVFVPRLGWHLCSYAGVFVHFFFIFIGCDCFSFCFHSLLLVHIMRKLIDIHICVFLFIYFFKSVFL